MNGIVKMNRKADDFFRQRLAAMRADLSRQDGLGRESQRTVTLDQQSVGRLSRMDAMQQQAMARATQVRRDQMKNRIDAAFARLDEGEFGYCLSCGEEIAGKRLEIDATAATCLSCASGG